jgi:hypothetical protein
MGKFKNLILTELGETTDVYDYYFDGKFGDDSVEYKFKTPNYTYSVFFKPDHNFDTLDIQFETDRTRTSVTNEGNHFRVTATILDITKKVWKRREELFDSYLAKIKFNPVPRDKEYGQDTNARERLYKRFIKKQFPNAKIIDKGKNTIVLPAQID